MIDPITKTARIPIVITTVPDAIKGPELKYCTLHTHILNLVLTSYDA